MIIRRLLGTKSVGAQFFMKAKWIAITVVCIFLLIVSLASRHVLQVEALREERIVFLSVVHPGEGFATKYIHSVEKCPVWEFFRIDENFRIILYKTTFSSSNTGLPYAPMSGEEFHNEGNYFRISNMHRVIPELCLWVNERYDNILKINNARVLRLPSLAGNTLLVIKVRKMKMFEILALKARLFLHAS